MFSNISNINVSYFIMQLTKVALHCGTHIVYAVVPRRINWNCRRAHTILTTIEPPMYPPSPSSPVNNVDDVDDKLRSSNADDDDDDDEFSSRHSLCFRFNFRMQSSKRVWKASMKMKNRQR